MTWQGITIVLMTLTLKTYAQVPPFYQNTPEVKELLRTIVNPSCVWVEVPDNKRYAQPVVVYPDGDVLIWNYTMYMNCPPDTNIWSNAACACVRDGDTVTSFVTPGKPPCNYLANVRLDPDAKKFTDDYRFITSGPSDQKADLGDLTVPDPSSVNGYSLRLTGVPLGFQEFASNDLQGNWRMELSVKPSTSSSMIVLSNDCTNEKPEAVQEDPENKKNRRPSMTLSLDSNLVLTLRFSDDKVEDLQCQVTANSLGWYPIAVDSAKFNITVTVSGNVCGSIYSVNPLRRSECKLYLGGRPGSPQDAFDGFVEYFRFIRDPQACDV
ncbi:uncharacterized protein LOC112572960 [Pomacea canaliculata]|uniref:uncharacterized protein LOC112572960 n=1 Tax=Pomacea canaliculata TaxID=400727 RepID=UPI000D73371C|nr:uncharacterized protein LOC112572960 [Pomacea canaliculata]